MAAEVKKNIFKFKSYLNNHALITDLLSKLMITFAVVLIVGGIYLMVIGQTVAQAKSSTQLAISTVNCVPGVPFNVGELSGTSVSVIGLVSWIIGFDFLLVGLGFWVRNKIARWVGLLIFVLAAFFQFVQFLYFGAIGAPTSIVEVSIDGILAYFLFSKFECLVPQAAMKE